MGWRIVDVERFLTTVRTPADASARLEDMVASVLAAELGGRDLADLVRVGDGSALGPLTAGVTGRIAEQAGREYGLAVADVRIRRLNYPAEVREAVELPPPTRSPKACPCRSKCRRARMSRRWSDLVIRIPRISRAFTRSQI